MPTPPHAESADRLPKESGAPVPQRAPRIWKVAAICAVYFALNAASEILAQRITIGPQVSLREAPGLALALLVVFGTGYAPMVFVAYLFSSLVLNTVHHELWIETLLPVIHASCFTVTAWIVRRRFGPAPLPKDRGESGLLILAAFAATVPWVIIGSWMLQRGSGAVSGDFLPGAFFRWLSGTSSILTILPISLVVGARWRRSEDWRPRRPSRSGGRIETLAQFAALLLSLFVIEALSPLHSFRAYALCFVPLAWIALTRGLPGAAVAVLVTNVGAFLVVRLSGSPEAAIFDYLMFSLAYAIVGLGLGGSVTFRDRAEAEKDRLLEIIEAAPDFISTLDLNGCILYANPALLRLRGLADARGRSMAEFRPVAARRLMVETAVPAALARGIWIGESSLLDVREREVPVSELLLVQRDEAGRPAYYSIIARDVSAQRKAERERLETERKMLEAQKLESLGVLSGGIAHDFNNLLTVMLGNASLATMQLPPDSASAGYIQQIQTAVLRAADLCQQLLAYCGKGQFSPSLTDLTALVEGTTHLLQVSISKKCELQFDLARGLPPVFVDATQMRQIIMNLVINASDAIGERGGLIKVVTGVSRIDAADPAPARPAPELSPGHYVFLEVTDNGGGMAPEVKARIFEPFFTTKFTGRGLGLAAVMGIVRGHRGALQVDSEPGRGSRFTLLLPAARGEVAPSPGAAREAGPPAGSGTILVVDDEEDVRVVAARLLESQGFRAVLAADGREAVGIVSRSPGEFRAVLLDLTMPRMDGEETFRELRKLRPDLPVLLMSGYSEKDSTERFVGGELAGFIAKPFDESLLAAKIGAVLCRSESGIRR
jgi:PAS domain S-box-containing protein